MGLEKAKTKFLLYHDLASLCGGDKARARELFHHQISLMAGWGYSFRSMPEFLAGEASGSRDIVITFDDGGRSFIDCALPVLEEFSATATMFVVAGFPGHRGEGMELLDWDEIAELEARGIDIGSHTLSHLPLPDVTADEVRREILRRGRGVSSGTGSLRRRSPTRTAGHRTSQRRWLARVGFKAAFTIKKGGRDVFELRRRLFTLTEPTAVVRFFLQDNYFPVRKAIVSVVPERMRREGKPIPDELWGARAFGIDGWTPPI